MTEGAAGTAQPKGGAEPTSKVAETGLKPVPTPNAAPNTVPNAAPNTAPNAAPNTAPNAAPNTAPKTAPNTAPKTAPVPVKQAPPVAAPKVAPPPGGAQQHRVTPPARPARMRRRHWGVLGSFFVMVLVPFLGLLAYLMLFAEDQYSSVTGFTVRQEEGGNASELLGGLAQLTGATGGASDGDILYEFILSQSLVRTVDEQVGLVDHYSAHWTTDPLFSLWPEPTIEDLEWYWQRIVSVSFDAGSGLIEVQVVAFDPETAREISQVIVAQSQDMINALNEQAREDAMRYARADLDEAVARLKTAREALTAFRTRTQIVDPEADIQGRMGVMNNLQQQLAEALIEYDLLTQTTSGDDPRVVQARRRIEVIRIRISDERQSFASDSPVNAPASDDYPSLIAEYEGLVVDREFAESTYRAALTALDLARTTAQRKSRYLATYVEPTLAESSQYPRRLTIIGLAGLFLLLGWGVLVLVYYSIRDRA